MSDESGGFWVAHTRTIWTDLVVKHADNFARANEELTLYRTAEVSSEMNYQAWSAIHAELDVALTRIAEEGSLRARQSGVSGERSSIFGQMLLRTLYTRLIRPAPGLGDRTERRSMYWREFTSLASLRRPFLLI
jgi:hypothetical protein